MTVPGNATLPIARAFIVILLMCTALFGGVAAVVVFQVDSMVRESREAFVTQSMKGLGRELGNYVLHRNNLLKDYAAFPIMIQAVMQPATNQGNMQDFMDDLSLLGKKAPLTLMDFSGKTLYSTQPHPHCHYRHNSPSDGQANAQPSLLLNLSVCTSSVDQKTYWHIVTPIIYQGQTEGYLFAEIDLADIVNSLSLEELSKHHQLSLSRGAVAFLYLGRPMDSPATAIELPKLGLTLTYRTDESMLRKGRNTLLMQVTFSMLFTWTLILALTNRLGNRYFVRPLQRLSHFATNLADGGADETDNIGPRILEINELEIHLRNVAAKVRQRESSRREVGDQQKAANEQLVQLVQQVTLRESSLQRAKSELETLNGQIIEQQQLLVQAEKMASVGQLAAGVAHEINNPTGFVMGNLEILVEYKDSIQCLLKGYEALEADIVSLGNGAEIPDSDTLLSILEKVRLIKSEQDIAYIMADIDTLLVDSLRGTERIHNIVKDLKSFSRVDDGDTKEVELNEEVIETALRLVWNEMKYKCTLKKSLTALPLINCRPGELSQVIMNLLINACDAIEQEGEVTLSSHCENSSITIEVSDTGTGISDEHVLKLFDPFFTTKDIGKGTGLGLSISHGIVQRHGGSLTVSSQLGKGTTFTVNLPVEAPTEITQPPSNRLSGESIEQVK
jgi:two-component system NtrC family sensor kinase